MDGCWMHLLMTTTTTNATIIGKERRRTMIHRPNMELSFAVQSTAAAAAATERASSKCFILMHLNIRSQLRI